MDALNKLLIKVDDDIEAVDQKAEDGLSDCEKLTGKLAALEKSQKDKCDNLMGEVKALLVSKTYATREDLSRSIKSIPPPIRYLNQLCHITNNSMSISECPTHTIKKSTKRMEFKLEYWNFSIIFQSETYFYNMMASFSYSRKLNHRIR